MLFRSISNSSSESNVMVRCGDEVLRVFSSFENTPFSKMSHLSCLTIIVQTYLKVRALVSSLKSEERKDYVTVLEKSQVWCDYIVSIVTKVEKANQFSHLSWYTRDFNKLPDIKSRNRFLRYKSKFLITISKLIWTMHQEFKPADAKSLYK